MMGEYLIYCRGKVIGGIYDDHFLVKATDSARRLLPDAVSELPYQGVREMLLVDVDDRELLNRIVLAIADDLPMPRNKRQD